MRMCDVKRLFVSSHIKHISIWPKMRCGHHPLNVLNAQLHLDWSSDGSIVYERRKPMMCRHACRSREPQKRRACFKVLAPIYNQEKEQKTTNDDPFSFDDQTHAHSKTICILYKQETNEKPSLHYAAHDRCSLVHIYSFIASFVFFLQNTAPVHRSRNKA